jgi:hypothetical protein
MVVSASAFVIYSVNTGYYLSEEARLILNQNLRTGLSAIARDVRMAGSGLSVLGPNIKLVEFYSDSAEILDGQRPAVSAGEGWFGLPDAPVSRMGVRAIFGLDGGGNFADSITIFSANVEYPSPLGQALEYANGRIVLVRPTPPGVVKDGDLICLVNQNRAVMLATKNAVDQGDFLEIKANGRFTGDGPPPGFPIEGAQVYNLRNAKAVTYFVDDRANRLMVAFHDRSLSDFDDPASRAVVVSDNIEDLQVFYFFQNDEVDLDRVAEPVSISSERLQNDSVKAVFLGLMARSTYGKGPSVTRPGFFNRLSGTKVEPFRRATMTEIVYLRNFQR